MCGKRIKIGLSALLCLFVLLPGPTCWAGTTQLSQQDSIRLEQIFSELSANNKILLQDSTQSALDLIQAQKELKQSKIELQELKELLVRLQAASTKIEADLTSSNDLLTRANQSLAEEQRKINSKINSLRRDRTLWEIVAGMAVAGAMYSVIK